MLGHYIAKIIIMQVDDKQHLNTKKQILVNAVSSVIKELVKNSGKSGRKISQEYDIGLGVISKLERNLVSDIKLSTIWKLANAFDISPLEIIKKTITELPEDFNFYD